MLEKEFAKLGFNDNEREVYLAVLRAGKIAPNRVAKETGINRTTVYSIGKKLVGLGLIAEDVGGKFAYFYAEKPDALAGMFAKEEAALAAKRALAEKVTAEIAALPSATSYSIPKIKFVEEDDLNDYFFKQSDAWQESSLPIDGTWWGYHDSSCTKSYGEWIRWTWKRPYSERIFVKFFSNEDPVEGEMSAGHERRIIRTLPAGVAFDSSLWVVGDYVIMAQTRKRPHYLVEIHDAVLARNQRELFKAMWGVSEG